MHYKDLQLGFKRYALLGKGLKEQTYKSCLYSLNMLCEYANVRSIKELSTDIIRDFLYHGREAKLWTAKTYRNHWQSLKSFFDYCLAKDFIKKNPVVEIEKPKLEKVLPRYISENDIKEILIHTAEYPWFKDLARSKNLAVIHTLFRTGLRLQEMLNLEVTDVNLAEREIFVRQGKGSKDRTVPIHPSLLPFLKNYVSERRKRNKPSRWFFTGLNSDKQMYQKDIQRMIKKIVKSSGVYFSAHMLRHTFARQMIDAGLDLYKLKEILGHSSITTTQRYMSASRESIKNAFSKLSFL